MATWPKECPLPPPKRVQVVAQAFEYAREKGYRVIPTCSYVPVFVEKNPQWTDLVAE